MDSIHISAIRAYGYTGVLPEEQTLGQWFEVDLTLWLDLAPSGISDRLEDTLDYRDTIKHTQELIQTSKFQLIEKLAETIAQTILATQNLKQIQVRLTKLAPAIPNFGGQVTVDIVRSAG
jgi:dihydroneopterin aldolase